MCCACYKNENNCKIVENEVSLVHLASYLTDSLKFNQKEDRSDKWNLQNRFPVSSSSTSTTNLCIQSQDIGPAIEYFLSFADD